MFGSSFARKEHHPSLASAHYSAYLFGPFRVLHAKQALGEPTWRRNKAKALLKWFLLNPGELFSVEQLSKLFWHDSHPKVAASNLHVTLHYLRHVLEPSLTSGQLSTFIHRNRYNYYWFDLHDDWWTDIADVYYLSTQAKEAEQQGNLARAFALYNQLIAYYKLTFLPEDIYEDAFSSYRRQHEYAAIQTLEHLMRLSTRIEYYDEALSCALYTLSIDPYNERAVKTLVHVHLQQGNTTGALCQLNEFEQMLQQEMGIQPGKEIMALRNVILNAR
ncbi:AfsR/SARP family transcriptional regulator [Ktedonospora formicarum]|nr:BTAD domain-containing putative transcriptional regulator [Ktedonospora formicarum]